MKTLLGVDFGKRFVGLALASTPLVEPLATITYDNKKELIRKLLYYIKKQQVEAVVLGVASKANRRQLTKLIDKLTPFFRGNIYFQDETLSTYEAEKLRPVKGRLAKTRIHQMAACIILQQFIDDHPQFLIE